MKKIGLLSVLTAFSVLFSFIILLSVPVGAAESTGYWKYVKTENQGPESQLDDDQAKSVMSGGNGSYTCQARCKSGSAYHDGKELTSCAGENVTINISVTAPPQTIRGGSEVALTVTPSFSASNPHDSLLFYTCQINVDWAKGGYNAEGHFKDGKGNTYVGIDRTWEYNEYYGASGKGNHFIYSDSDFVLRATIPNGSKGSSLWIRISFAHGRGEDAINTYYRYEWVPDENPAGSTTKPGDQGKTEQGGTKPGSDKTADENGFIHQVETTIASVIPGYDESKGIISAIILGITGAAAAACAAGSGKNGSKENKQYRMYVWKDFGDAIQKGGKPKKVYARISEFIDGKEYDCPEQTCRIKAGGAELTVRPLGMEGSYFAAEISAPANTEKEQGTLTFSLSGQGGLFERNIVFRIVGEPRIVFPRELSPGVWDINSDSGPVLMVAGKGGFEKHHFVIVDAVEEPKEIHFVNADGFDIESEEDPKYAYSYFACIRSLTGPITKENGIFADPEDRTVTVEAAFANGQKISGGFMIELYPDGFSVMINKCSIPLRSGKPGFRTVLKDGRIEVISYATRDKEELTLDPVIPFTCFTPCYAMVKQDETALIAKEHGYFSVEKFVHTDEKTKNLLSKYHVKIKWDIDGYRISPEDSLPEMTDEYIVKLPLTVNCEDVTEKYEIPMRLLGEPFDPKKDWEREYKGLCNTVIRYFPGDVAHKWVRHIRENYSYPEIWDASVLRAMRFDVIRAAQNYWLDSGKEQGRLVDYYDMTELIFKKPPRFLADTAFSIVVRFYAGENENWITPCKDLIVDTIDEALWNYLQTGSADVDIIEKIMEQATNAFSNYISIVDGSGVGILASKKALSKLGFALCAYMLADWIKNYYTMDPKDFWKSVQQSFIDLSVMAIQKVIAAGFIKGLNHPKVQKFFQAEWIKKTVDYLHKNLASESVRIQGTGTDIHGITGHKYNRVIDMTGNIKESEWAEKFGNGVKYVYFGNDHSSLNIKDLYLDDNKTKAMMAGMIGGKTVGISLIDLEHGSTATASYLGWVQSTLENLFGAGVAAIFNSTVLDNEEDDFGTVTFPIGYYSETGRITYCRINFYEMFRKAASGEYISKAFDWLYETLFGSFKFPGSVSSDDIGREILKGLDA